MPAVAPSDVSQRLLVIDRDAELADTLSGAGIAQAVQRAENGRSGAAVLQAEAFDVVLADLQSLADLDAAPDAAIARLARLGKSALLLVVTETDSVSAAVEALQAGAHDCLVRPVAPEEFDARIAILRTRHDHHGAVSLSHSGARASGSGRFVAHAPQMQVVLEHLERIAASPAPVFLSGERGTGKRLAAETLHALGPHAGQPFIAIDCTRALAAEHDPDLDEGLVRLAGKDGARALTDAGGGMLYLREIGALGSAEQARLISFVEPDTPGPLDLRIVCSTRRSPAELAGSRALRQDLFYRLNVLPIHLPPLRQRPEDIAPLAAHFLSRFARRSARRFSGFSTSAIAYLDGHDWAGNVHELETLIERTVAMFDGLTVTPQMLAAADSDGQAAAAGGAIVTTLETDSDILPMWQQEQRIIEAAIARYNGNIARAAAALEISPSTIYRKKQAWEERGGTLAGAA